MNPFDILKNLPQMQARAKEMQEKIKNITVIGNAGGDMVTIEMDGQMNVLNVNISPAAQADSQMLEDLVAAAVNDAVTKVKEQVQEEIAGLTGGLNLPPGIFGV